VRSLAAQRDGQRASFRELPYGAPEGGSQVADRVPAFDEDEPPSTVVAEPHVGGPRGLAGSSRQLEQPLVPGASTQPQHELLHPQMPRIGRFLERIPVHRQH
jgi:hypothetical protein